MDEQCEIAALLHQMPATTAEEENWLHRLALLLNHLVMHDFNALVQLLYRVDVSEQTVKELLLQQPEEHAGLLLAHLLLNREQEKREARKQFKKDATDIPDEERW